MRLGAQICHLEPDSLIHKMYNKNSIIERHRHRYEVNNNLLDEIVKAGLKVTGLSTDRKLVEIIENPDHPCSFGFCEVTPGRKIESRIFSSIPHP